MGKKSNELLNNLLKITGDNIGFITLFAVMSLLPKLLQAHYLNKMHHLPLAVFPPFFIAVTIAWLLTKRRQWLKTVILSIILVMQALLFAVEMFVLDFQSLMLNSAIMSPVMETSWREAAEFCRTYLGWQIIIGAAALIVTASLAQRFSCRMPVNKSMRVIMAVVMVLGFLTTAREIVQGGQENSVREAWISMPVAVGGAYRERRGIDEAQENLDKAANKIIVNNAKIKNVVFIVGESESRHHLHCYGYGLPTTPFTEKWQQRGNLTIFTDVISAYSTTNPSLQHLFTFANYENNNEKWYNQSNLIDVVKRAGYKTAWLSSKDYKLAGSGMNWVFAGRCDEARFIGDGQEYDGFGDWKLLAMLKDEKTREAAKNFYVMHLMGSHANYPGRYPADYAKFTAEDIKKIRSDRDRQAADIAAYDNSVLYTDEFLHQVYEQFADEEAVVIYIPDHAEDVYDGTPSFAGHNPNGDKWQIEIPMFIWYSDKFKAANPEIIAQIAAASDRPYMTDDMIHTILDIMGLQTEESDASRSIINDTFNASRQRIYEGKNYDEVMK